MHPMKYHNYRKSRCPIPCYCGRFAKFKDPQNSPDIQRESVGLCCSTVDQILLSLGNFLITLCIGWRLWILRCMEPESAELHQSVLTYRKAQ